MTQRTTIWMATLLVALAMATPGVAATVRLRSEVTLEDPVVRLSDVARITGAGEDMTQRLGSIVLERMDPGDRSTVVGADAVRQRIYEHGVNMTLVLVKGAASTRVFKAAPGSVVQTVSRDDKQTERPHTGDDAGNETRLRGLIADWVVDRAKLERDTFEIEFVRVGALPETSGYPTLTIVKPKVVRFGRRMTFELSDATGRPVMEVPATVHLLTWRVVAVNDLRPGTDVNPQDVRLVRARSDEGRQVGFSSLEEVTGLRVLRPVAAGQPVTARAVRQPVLVERGQVVTMRMNAGGMMMTRRVKALKAGSRGDIIDLADVDDRKATYRGTVIERGVVQMTQ